MQWHGQLRTGNGTPNEREREERERREREKRERDGIYCQQCNTDTQQSTATAGIVGTHNQQCRERRICFDTHDVMILRREVEKHETGHNNHTKQTQPRGRSLELRTNNNSEEEEEKWCKMNSLCIISLKDVPI